MASFTPDRELNSIKGIPIGTSSGFIPTMIPTYSGKISIIDNIDLRDGMRHLAAPVPYQYIPGKAPGKAPGKVLVSALTPSEHRRAVRVR